MIYCGKRGRLAERASQRLRKVILLSKQRRLVRAATVAGIAGPLTLSASIVSLSVAQYGFMRELGWHPLHAASTDWPSGLALGPYGRVLTASFVLCGLALPVFAAGLATALDGECCRRSSPGSTSLKVGRTLLTAAGAAMALLASGTDPTLSQQPPTVHGRVHDGAFGVLGLTLLPALILFGLRMVRDARWRAHGIYTLSTALLATACFLLRGVAFYLFLAAVLVWFAVTAVRLCRY